MKKDNTNDRNNLLEADADYWLNAPQQEVRKYLSENTDIEKYEIKKQVLLLRIQEKLNSKKFDVKYDYKIKTVK